MNGVQGHEGTVWDLVSSMSCNAVTFLWDRLHLMYAMTILDLLCTSPSHIALLRSRHSAHRRKDAKSENDVIYGNYRLSLS